MADADEDAIPRGPSQDGGDDLEDETQDFRFLSQLTSSAVFTGQTQSTIPKRGEKDFEPNPTRLQANALEASRQAMHTALSAVRVHNEKGHIIGQYLPDEKDWAFEGRCVVAYKFKSTFAKSLGRSDWRNWTWFTPEEALWLLERGTLDIRWPNVIDDQERPKNVVPHPDSQHAGSKAEANITEQSSTEFNTKKQAETEHEADPEPGDLPMSLQGAYASLIGISGLTLERYVVYAGLRRLGYILNRAPSWDGTHSHTNGHTGSSNASAKYSLSSLSAVTSISTYGPVALIHRLVLWLFTPERKSACPAAGPFIAPGLYRSYNDIFRALALVQYQGTTHEIESSQGTVLSTSSVTPSQQPQPPFSISYHIWKPNTTYKKSTPPPPDYRVAVINARPSSTPFTADVHDVSPDYSSSTIPSLTQISALLDSLPSDVLPDDKRLEMRLKHGRKNVLLAIVDAGVVSYLRFSDACFGDQKLWEDKERARRAGPKHKGGARKGKGKASPGQGRGNVGDGLKTGTIDTGSIESSKPVNA